MGTKIWASKVDIESKRTAHIREDSPAKRLQRSQASARKHRPQRNDSMAPATSTKLSFAVALLVALLSPASAFTATPALAHLGARPATCAGCQPRAPAPLRPRAPAPLRAVLTRAARPWSYCQLDARVLTGHVSSLTPY